MEVSAGSLTPDPRCPQRTLERDLGLREGLSRVPEQGGAEVPLNLLGDSWPCRGLEAGRDVSRILCQEFGADEDEAGSGAKEEAMSLRHSEGRREGGARGWKFAEHLLQTSHSSLLPRAWAHLI